MSPTLDFEYLVSFFIISFLEIRLVLIVITFSLFPQLHLKGNYYIYAVSLKSALMILWTASLLVEACINDRDPVYIRFSFYQSLCSIWENLKVMSLIPGLGALSEEAM